MKENCEGKHHNCGEFTGHETKEEKLKHLRECKANLMKKIEQIDKAIAELK